MGVGRLEAFSDGVFAIIITIMVLELKVPHGDGLTSLKPLYPIFISYILSFINVGIYWNNHHHLFQTAEHVNGKVMWNNLHLLFWLSLIPFATAWMGENDFTLWPVVVYGLILVMCGIAYFFLVKALIHVNGKESILAMAVGADNKGVWSVVIYLAGIALAFVHPWFGFAMYVLVAAIWFLPDRRIEKEIKQHEGKQG